MSVHALSAITAYFLGSIPFAYLMVWLLARVDIRQHGDRSVGAKNSYKTILEVTGNKKLAQLVLPTVMFLDIFKGFLAVWASLVYSDLFASNPVPHVKITSGVFVIIGHNFPVFLRFKGGKGFASLLGITVHYNFLPPLLIYIVFFSILYFLSKHMPLSTMGGAFLASIIIYFFGANLWIKEPLELSYTVFLVLVIMLIRHFSTPRVKPPSTSTGNE